MHASLHQLYYGHEVLILIIAIYSTIPLCPVDQKFFHFAQPHREPIGEHGLHQLLSIVLSIHHKVDQALDQRLIYLLLLHYWYLLEDVIANVAHDDITLRRFRNVHLIEHLEEPKAEIK